MRYWLRSSKGVWVGACVLLLPTGLFALFLVITQLFRRVHDPGMMDMVAVLLSVTTGIGFVGLSGLLRGRITADNRGVWLRWLMFCVVGTGLLWAPFSLLLLLGRDRWLLLLVSWPFLTSLWLYWQVQGEVVRKPRVKAASGPSIWARLLSPPQPEGVFVAKLRDMPFYQGLAVLMFGVLALFMAVQGVWSNDLLIVGKHNVSHVHGSAVWPFAGAYLCLATGCLSILPEYRSAQERLYRYHLLRWWLTRVGWTLFFVGAVIDLGWRGSI